MWIKSIRQSADKTRGSKGLSINDVILSIELLQPVRWTSFHNNFNLLFVFQCVNLCLVLCESMNVC